MQVTQRMRSLKLVLWKLGSCFIYLNGRMDQKIADFISKNVLEGNLYGFYPIIG